VLAEDGLTISQEAKWPDYQEPKVNHMDVVSIFVRMAINQHLPNCSQA